MTHAIQRSHDESLDPARIALGIQQPWAELILRGIKTLEIRSLNTQVRGRIYLYTSKRLSTLPAAQRAAAEHDLRMNELPCGLLVGSVELTGSRPACATDVEASCVPAELLAKRWAWEFSSPKRLANPAPIRFLPYGVWFYPFRRRTKSK
jgi:hypothetical protein